MRPQLSTIDAPQQVHLEYGCVFRVFGLRIKVAGFGAHAAMDTAFHIHGHGRVNPGQKDLLGTFDAFVIRQSFNRLNGLAQLLNALPKLFKRCLVDAHARTPRRPKDAPV